MTQRPESYLRYADEQVFDALEAFERQAFGRGVSLAGLALAWLLGVSEVTAIVVGPTRAEHLEPVREALALELTTADREHLRGCSREGPLRTGSARAARHGVVHRGDEEVLASLARGELHQPLRSIARPPGPRRCSG